MNWITGEAIKQPGAYLYRRREGEPCSLYQLMPEPNPHHYTHPLTAWMPHWSGNVSLLQGEFASLVDALADVERRLAAIEQVQSLPSGVEEARRQGRCRICGKKADGPLTMNYGAEFAHTACLEPAAPSDADKIALAEALAEKWEKDRREFISDKTRRECAAELRAAIAGMKEGKDAGV